MAWMRARGDAGRPGGDCYIVPEKMRWRKMDIFEIILRLGPIWHTYWMWEHEEERGIKDNCKFPD